MGNVIQIVTIDGRQTPLNTNKALQEASPSEPHIEAFLSEPHTAFVFALAILCALYMFSHWVAVCA